MKKVLFVIYQAPCGSIWPNEGFRSAFGMYGEDIEPEVLLIDQAVIAVAQETEPKKLGLFSLKMVQRYIDRYETKVYVDKASLEKFKVKDIDPDYQAEIIDHQQMVDLVHDKDLVIYF
jgi:tRNA 2-thiouridine synthesizing protein C